MLKKLLLIFALISTYNTKVSAIDENTMNGIKFVTSITAFIAVRIAVRYIVTKAVDKVFDKQEEQKKA